MDEGRRPTLQYDPKGTSTSPGSVMRWRAAIALAVGMILLIGAMTMLWIWLVVRTIAPTAPGGGGP